MTPATKQLTEALQELTSRSVQFEARPREHHPEPGHVALQQLSLSREVNAYLERKREYAENTRTISVGSY